MNAFRKLQGDMAYIWYFKGDLQGKKTVQVDEQILKQLTLRK